MAKNKDNVQNNNSQLVNDISTLLKNINAPLPSNASPIEIAQHANAMVRVAGTPNSTVSREIVSKTADALLKQYDAQTATLLNNA